MKKNTFYITKATLANSFDSSLNRGQDNKFQIPPLTCEGGAGGRGLRLSADGWRWNLVMMVSRTSKFCAVVGKSKYLNHLLSQKHFEWNLFAHFTYFCREVHRVHRVATATFWRAFHYNGKTSPCGWGWGVHAHPLSLYLPSRTKLLCTLQLRGQIYTRSLYVLCWEACQDWY